MIAVKILGCPNRSLSPNTRVHWRTKARAVSRSRHDMYYAALDAVPFLGQSEFPVFETPVIVRPIIAWGRGRKIMDGDNALACLKPYFDGLTDANLWLDDSLCTFLPVEQTRDPDGVGYVVVVIEPATADPRVKGV